MISKVRRELIVLLTFLTIVSPLFMALFVEKRKMHWPAASRSRFACKTFMELNWAIISRHAKGEMKFRLRLLLRKGL